ncbi:MAG: hypothetical protein WBV94_31870 [Blastocatellia bacterium]
MSSRLHTKLDRLEQQAASVIDRIQKRAAWVEETRAGIRSHVEKALAFCCYIGEPPDRQELEMDMIEQVFMMEYEIGDALRTDENMRAGILRAEQYLVLEHYGHEVPVEELLATDRLLVQAHEDIKAGIPAQQSEAARQFREAACSKPPLLRIRKRSHLFEAYLAGAPMPDWMQ